MKQSLSRLVRVLVATVLTVASQAMPSEVAHATGATLTVDSNSDADNGSDGVCTLHEAIHASVMNADYQECTNSGEPYGDDHIGFAIVGSGVIVLTSNLPHISNGVLTINGQNGRSSVVIDGAHLYQGLYVESTATLTLGHITVRNGAATSGGAIQNSGMLVVLRSTFLGNAATHDGGAINNGGQANISNSTFSGNSAANGGAVMNNSGSLAILNSTLSGNSATDGGALMTYKGSADPPETTLYNTILANSSAPEDCYRTSGTGTMIGSNNIIESTPAGSEGCSSVATWTSDPELGALTGTPAYFPLLTGSPAIDAGDEDICVGAPVFNTSQNGIPRPQDGDDDGSPICDIGSTEAPVTAILKSTASRDGWVLESTETSSMGGGLDVDGTTLRLGDDANDRQYRSILSFSTSALVDNAVITSVKLKLKHAGVAGANPFSTMGTIRVDIRRGAFGSAVLESTDFQATAHKDNAVTISNHLTSGWYIKSLASSNYTYINKAGVTQLRLRFGSGDNDNGTADYLKIYSGDAGSASRPALILTYYDPTP